MAGVLIPRQCDGGSDCNFAAVSYETLEIAVNHQKTRRGFKKKGFSLGFRRNMALLTL